MAPTSTMAAEIAERPAAVARTLQALRPLRGDLRRLAASTRLVTFIARGSSDNAATYGRYLCEAHAGRPASLAAPSVATHDRARVDLGGALAVALSQSGETGEIVETLRWAATSGSRTVAITNDGASSLAGAADLALIVPGQLLVEALARGLGFDPDRPVGLSKLTQTSGAVGAAPGGKDGGR
jgi:glutamine---fructose-6-phosphate transaminase (isomerizing)